MKRRLKYDGDNLTARFSDTDFSTWYKEILEEYPTSEYSLSFSIVGEIVNLDIEYSIEFKVEKRKPAPVSHEHDEMVFTKIQENQLALNNTSIYTLCEVVGLSTADTDVAIKNLVRKGLIEIDVPVISDYHTVFSITVSDYGWSTV